MKKILFIATGGTIASAKTENGLTPAITSEELLNAVPEIRAANYPDEGRSRIVELTLTWPADAASLQKMEKAVEESLQAASVYVRYRDTEWEKAGLLYTYLMERFTYTERERR